MKFNKILLTILVSSLAINSYADKDRDRGAGHKKRDAGTSKNGNSQLFKKKQNTDSSKNYNTPAGDYQVNNSKTSSAFGRSQDDTTITNDKTGKSYTVDDSHRADANNRFGNNDQNSRGSYGGENGQTDVSYSKENVYVVPVGGNSSSSSNATAVVDGAVAAVGSYEAARANNNNSNNNGSDNTSIQNKVSADLSKYQQQREQDRGQSQSQN